MDLKLHSTEKGSKKTPHCPECGKRLQVLLFMGTVSDGYVCPDCKVVVDQKTIKVIGRSF